MRKGMIWGRILYPLIMIRDPPPSLVALKMGADGSRHGTPAASFEALPLCRPHGTYEH